jgi:aspartate/tyrosine/aromatic aminotransferase
VRLARVVPYFAAAPTGHNNEEATSMFEKLEPAPPDPILGLTEAFNKDPRPEKINLGVGVYQDATGRTPTFASVREAQKRLLEANASMTYLPIVGSVAYGNAVRDLVFGADSEIAQSNRSRTAHTPGGTGALRIAADFLAAHGDRPTVWLSQPTWPNHNGVFQAAGLPMQTYPYYDRATQGIDFAGMVACLGRLGPKDVVLLHACCHNPSGLDPSAEQWTALAELQRKHGFFPMFDFAYQGLGRGLEQDSQGLQAFSQAPEMLIASSFSKNFGLYNQRTGALSFVGQTSQAADLAFGHIKRSIRASYSNPPAYGGALVTTVLGDPVLRGTWRGEVDAMRTRIAEMRAALVHGLRAEGVDRDFSYLTQQYGMFSFSGLSDAHVAALRDRFAIYIVKGGRINVAGITPGNVGYICKSIATVLKAG